MSITTKIGDKGTTRLYNGDVVSKNSPHINAVGCIDELVSYLGVVYQTIPQVFPQNVGVVLWLSITPPDMIELIQRKLFVLGSHIASGNRVVDNLTDSDITLLENWCKSMEETVKIAGFILPGGTLVSAHIDHARTIARRLEREVIALSEPVLGEFPYYNSIGNVWLNRLSDCLWLLARVFEQIEGVGSRYLK